MKRALSKVLCYAIGMVAYCVHAAEPAVVSVIDFSHEELWGKSPHYGLSDNGDELQFSNTYWWVPVSNGNYSVMCDYSAYEHRYDRFSETNLQPDYMASGYDNFGFYAFEQTESVYRTFNPVNGDGTSEWVKNNAGCDVFVDQLLQFTRRDERVDESMAAQLPDGAKFACWLASDTNALVLTAGRYAADGSIYVTNYVSTANVETGRWYRLTVRSIATAATQKAVKAPALAVYLDGEPVVCGEGYSVGDDMAAMDELFRGNLHYIARALFPSISSEQRVRGLALRGKGAFDELGVVNAYNPLAPGASSELDLYVAVDPAKVTNVVITVNGIETQSAGVEMTRVTVRPNEAVHVDVLTTDDYAPLSLACFGNSKAVRRCTGFDLTLAKTFDQSDPIVARVNVGEANFEVGGVLYESVREAMAAANASQSGLFTLHRDLVISQNPAQGAGQIMVDPSYTLVFDLHGRTLRGDHFKEEATIYNQGRLTIIDSVGGGAIVAPGTVIEVATTNTALEVKYEQASLTLGSREIVGDFTVTGRVVCSKGELTIKGGTYVTPTDLMPTNGFYLAAYVAPERFLAVNDLELCPTPGAVWTVRYDGRFRVAFEAEHGEPVPAYTNVAASAGATLLAPALIGAAGYTVTNWFVKGANPRLDWNLALDAVTNDMTLVAQQRLESYRITYAKATALEDWPTEYSVESARQALPQPAKVAAYSFRGWFDRNSGRLVAEIGAGATWPGTEEVVTGDLDLEAVWEADVLKWTNVGTYSSESNGVYAGAWSFTVPASAQAPVGTEVVIDEIDFAIVNPLTFPKSAPCLAVTPFGGASVVSATRPTGYDPASGEYAAATNRMVNGRVRLAYVFSGLVVRAGEVNDVRFSSSAGTPTPTAGFLRLALQPQAGDAVFGNCTEPEDYRVFVPVYEVFGHVKGEVE